MKNCYIANCDKWTKFDASRSMFKVPSADEMYQVWKSVIPVNKRPLSKTDRICDKHFNESDIERMWTHRINGVLMEMERDRPCLKKNAVPSLNLNIELEKPNKRKAETLSRKILKSSQPIKKPYTDEIIILKIGEDTTDLSQKDRIESDELEERTVELQTNETSNVIEIVETREDKSKVKILNSEDLSYRLAEFQSMFDEVFTVTLPSLLWGIHRCPEANFMAFSRLCVDSMTSDIVVHIDPTWAYTITFKGHSVKKGALSVLTEESITVLLDEAEGNRYSLVDGEVKITRKYVRKSVSDS